MRLIFCYISNFKNKLEDKRNEFFPYPNNSISREKEAYDINSEYTVST